MNDTTGFITKIGSVLTTWAPFVAGGVILYLFGIGIACMISDNFRQNAKIWFISGFIGFGICAAAFTLGQALANIFFTSAQAAVLIEQIRKFI